MSHIGKKKICVRGRHGTFRKDAKTSHKTRVGGGTDSTGPKKNKKVLCES